MAYKTKAEKRAWRKGLFAGLFGRKKKKDVPKVKPKKRRNMKALRSKIEKKNPSRMRASGFRFSKVNPYSEQRDPKLEAKRKEFFRLGGGLSGVYDVSKPDVAKFVREYKEFIAKKEIYKRDKHNNLVPVYRTK